MTEIAGDMTDVELHRLLEEDYRRLLRWYPRSWRAEHGDALIGTLLDDADASDRFTVRRGEWVGFAGAGVNARLNRTVMQPVRDAAATVMLSMGTGVAIAMFVFGSWAPWGTGTADLTASFGPFYDAGPIVSGLWVVALIAALADRWWVGRVTLALAVAVSIALPWVQPLIAPPASFVLDPVTVAFLSFCCVFAVIGTPRTRAPLVGAVLGWAALMWAGYVLAPLVSRGIRLGPVEFLTLPVAPTGLIAVVLLVCAGFAFTGRWTPAFTILISAIPLTAGLAVADAWWIANGVIDASPWMSMSIVVPVMAGLIVLLLASQQRIRLSGRRWTRSEER